mgnify:CR=1 FL=1
MSGNDGVALQSVPHPIETMFDASIYRQALYSLTAPMTEGGVAFSHDYRVTEDVQNESSTIQSAFTIVAIKLVGDVRADIAAGRKIVRWIIELDCGTFPLPNGMIRVAAFAKAMRTRLPVNSKGR